MLRLKNIATVRKISSAFGLTVITNETLKLMYTIFGTQIIHLAVPYVRSIVCKSTVRSMVPVRIFEVIFEKFIGDVILSLVIY